MFATPGNSKHAVFLQAALRENVDKFADMRVCCSDGSVKQNRIFLGIVETYLQQLPEFCSPDVDVLVLLPDVSLHEYFDILNEKLFNHSESSQFCRELTEEVFYTGEGEEGIGFPENIENLEIIMHDVFAVSEDIATSEYQNALGVKCNAMEKPSILSQHLKELEKKFSCPHCDKKFLREKAFLAHKSNYHNEPVEVEVGKKPLLTCSYCTLKFEAPVQLEKHLRSHTKSKPFVCKTCKKCFVSKSNLSAHQRLHEGTALRYECDKCDKKFSHPSEVKQHSVVHTGIRAYTCHQCGNKYSRYPSLWKHLKKCNFTNKVVLVKPIKEDTTWSGTSGDIVIKALCNESKVTRSETHHEVVEVAGESVVIDEIVVTDDIGNDVILAD